eukprot:evm.model.scf_1561.4 EVM.evm.TU.scf_1561.4   scf_1561:25449-25937(+)
MRHPYIRAGRQARRRGMKEQEAGAAATETTTAGGGPNKKRRKSARGGADRNTPPPASLLTREEGAGEEEGGGAWIEVPDLGSLETPCLQKYRRVFKVPVPGGAPREELLAAAMAHFAGWEPGGEEEALAGFLAAYPRRRAAGADRAERQAGGGRPARTAARR